MNIGHSQDLQDYQELNPLADHSPDRERLSLYSCEGLRITDLIVSLTLNTQTATDTDQSKGTKQHLKGHFCTMVNSEKPEGRSELIFMRTYF